MDRLDDHTPRTVGAGHDAVPGAVDAFDREQRGHHLEHLVHGNGEADPLRSGPHRDVDADHLAIDVEQRAAGVARVDAGVGLDQVVVSLRAAHLHIAVEGRHDAAGHRVLVAVGIAKGEHRLPDHQVGRRADRDHGERLVVLDLDHREIGARVVGDERGRGRLPGGERDFDAANALDHVVVGDDVATGVDDDPGAHPVDSLQFTGALIIRIGHEFLPVDIDDAVAGRFDRLDDRRAASFDGTSRPRCGERHEQCDGWNNSPRTTHEDQAPKSPEQVRHSPVNDRLRCGSRVGDAGPAPQPTFHTPPSLNRTGQPRGPPPAPRDVIAFPDGAPWPEEWPSGGVSDESPKITHAAAGRQGSPRREGACGGRSGAAEPAGRERVRAR